MERYREGEAATRARNIIEAQRRLEGPGSERRLARLQAQFQRLGRVRDRRGLTKAQLMYSAAAVFLTVLAIGLLWR